MRTQTERKHNSLGMSAPKSCPANSFAFNGSLCACNPGLVPSGGGGGCELPRGLADVWAVGSGVSGGDESLGFAGTIFAFDSLRKFTQSQAVFLEATAVMLLSWLIFCFLLRSWKLGDGRGFRFRLRWWISRLDVCFATKHWLDDQKVVKKRKTELGGTFSIASWILFIGLFSALLYQIISKRTIEVHNVRATNAADLALFTNDMEFNITTISSMSCSHLRGLGTLVTGNPGFIDHRVAPLSIFANYSCHNTSNGPTISLKCNNCPFIQDNIYISWHFIDLPNDPATAVGFQFNLTAKSPARPKHISFVSGMLKNRSNLDDKPITFRGADVNILKFNLFPRIYHNLHDLKIVQPLFHKFLPGSSSSEIFKLQASLQNPNDGLINTTLYINFLSSYIVEIENKNILGPVSFLADLGGLYCISIGIFYCFLVQCEYRIKKLRNEDSILRKIRSRQKAQKHWDKLRKYVMYTYGCNTIDDDYNSTEKKSCCSGIVDASFHQNGSLKQMHQSRKHSLHFNRKVNLPKEEITTSGCVNSQRVKSCSAETTSSLEMTSAHSKCERVLKNEVLEAAKGKVEHSVGSHEGDVSQPQTCSPANDYKTVPLPLSLEFKAGSEISLSDIQKNLHNLYEYNVLLREKFIATQSALRALTTRASSLESERLTWS